MRINRLRGIGVGVVAFFVSSGVARADTVILVDGRTLEGSIRREGNTLLVRHRLGSTRVLQSEVVAIKDVLDPLDRLDALRPKRFTGTADERFQFGLLARDNGYPAEARQAFTSALGEDPDHAGARVALGYVRHEGQWMTTKERDRAVVERNRARGLVLSFGRWVTPQERARLVAERARQAEIDRQAELVRLAERARQAEVARQAELVRLLEAARQAEVARQAELVQRAALANRSQLQAVASVAAARPTRARRRRRVVLGITGFRKSVGRSRTVYGYGWYGDGAGYGYGYGHHEGRHARRDHHEEDHAWRSH